MSEEINHDRRHIPGTAIMTIAAAELDMIGSTTIKPGTTTSFGPLKQIDAGVLNVGYAHCRHIQPYGRHPS